MTFSPGAMTDSELKREIEHHRALIAELSTTAPARTALEEALDSFLKECEDRRALRSRRLAQAASQYPDNAS